MFATWDFLSNTKYRIFTQHRLALSLKFSVSRNASAMTYCERIASLIEAQLYKKIAIITDHDTANILAVALSERKIFISNLLPENLSWQKRSTLHIVHYLSKCEVDDVNDLLFFNNGAVVDHAIIKELHRQFQQASSLASMNKIFVHLCSIMGHDIVMPFELQNNLRMSVMPHEYANIFANQLFDTNYIADSNVVMVTDNSEVIGYDLCILTGAYNKNSTQADSEDALTKFKSLCSENQNIHIALNKEQKAIWFVMQMIVDVLRNDTESTLFSESIDFDLLSSIVVYRACLPQYITATGVEKLINNPYSYYERHILNLKNVHESEEEQEERNFGIAVHEVLSSTTPYINNMTLAQYTDYFIEAARDFIRNNLSASVFYGKIWKLRIKKIAQWLWHYEKNSMQHRLKTLTEAECEMILKLDDDSEMKILARADRVDFMNDGSVHVIDYKTGAIANQMEVMLGLKPQLLIEALIIRDGYVNGEFMHPKSVSISYINLTGRHDIGKVKPLECNLDIVKEQLRKLLSKFFATELPLFFANNKSKCG